MCASGMKPLQIATVLNEGGMLTPFDYHYKRIGKPNPYNHSHLWSGKNLENILKNPVYIGTLAQQMWAIKIISVLIVMDQNGRLLKKTMSLSFQRNCGIKSEILKNCQRRKTWKKGELCPLLGSIFCDNCGWKMRKASANGGGYIYGYHNRFGKNISPHISSVRNF